MVPVVFQSVANKQRLSQTGLLFEAEPGDETADAGAARRASR
ncbi:MAG TPA: hypothetical protein VGI74_21220 [Streptosporangiaceae bacterium]